MAVEVLAGPDAVARRGWELVLASIAAAQREGRPAYVALSGGGTPKALYALLVDDPGGVDWSEVHLFVSDDRVVDREDERSNSGAIERFLRQSVLLSEAGWHPVSATQEADAQQVAASYEDEIRETLGPAAVPEFDLVLLGVGSDGHTASLFAGKPALDVEDRLVVASSPGALPPPVERVTFTFPLVNAARVVVFLAPGKEKAEAFAEVRGQLERAPRGTDLPAARVRPSPGRLVWLVDQATVGLRQP